MISITLTDTDAIRYLNEPKSEDSIGLSVKLEETEEALDYALLQVQNKTTDIAELETELRQLTTKYDKAMESIIATNPITVEDKLAYSVAAIDKDTELEANPVQFKPTTTRSAWSEREMKIIENALTKSKYHKLRKLKSLIPLLPGRTFAAIRARVGSLGITVKSGVMYEA